MSYQKSAAPITTKAYSLVIGVFNPFSLNMSLKHREASEDEVTGTKNRNLHHGVVLSKLCVGDLKVTVCAGCSSQLSPARLII